MVQDEATFLNVQKAALFLGVHPNTIRRWAHEEKLQGQRIGTRGDWRFTREALQQLMRHAHPPGVASERSTRSSSQKNTQTTLLSSPVDFLTGYGEMGMRIHALDWSSTPVGRIEQWPRSLTTLVTTSLRSRFPIVIWWDRQHYTMFYNDDYIPFLGKTKHPGCLGRSGQECWKELWPTIGPLKLTFLNTPVMK